MAVIQGNWYASAGPPNEAYPQPDDTVRFVYADQPNGERYIVAKVFADDEGDFASTARLLAAAPDLLRALREIVDYDEGSNNPEDYGYEVLQRCKAAIAKAEGTDGENRRMD